MKFLVTGANGYLGHGIIDGLVNLGNEVVASDLCGGNADPRVDSIQADIFEIDEPFQFFGKPDVLVHLAWRNGFVHNADSHLEDLPKHYNFIKKMVDAGIRRVAVMGSMHEVGFHEGSIDENTPCFPMSLYGISKNALRQSLQAYLMKRDTSFYWLRGYYIVNNSSIGNSIFSKIVQASLRGEKHFPFTSGENQYDFLDYDDFCRQVVAAVTQDSVDGIINICSGKPEKLSSRVESFIQENGLEIKLDYGAFSDRPYDSKAVWGNDQKIRKILSATIEEDAK